MRVHVYVTLKRGILDVQGKTIRSALEALGFKGLEEVRVGKHLEIDLSDRPAASAKRDVERMCQKLLANPIVETYRVETARGRARADKGRRATPATSHGRSSAS